jgi:hypothetical protein
VRLRRKLHRLSDQPGSARNKVLKNAGLAALVLLAPGGFVLGTTLAVRAYRKRKAEREAGEAERG